MSTSDTPQAWNSPTGSEGQPPAQQYGQQNPYGAPQDPSSAPTPNAAAWSPVPQQSAADAPGSPYGAPQPGTSAQHGAYGSGAAPSYGAPQQPGGQQPYGAPQQPYGAAPTVAAGNQGPSRVMCGILGIFLGGWGVHRFVMGYTTLGIIQIVVTLVTCGMGALWGFVEGIMILARTETFQRDAHGRPLAD